MATDDLLAAAKEAYKLCAESMQQNHERGLEDMRFGRLGEQWPENITTMREREGRPTLTINKMPSYVRQVVNDSRLNRPSITVRPFDSGADVATADIITGLIRNIEYASSADTAYDTAVDNAVSCGFGWFRINIDYTHDDTFDLDLRIGRIRNAFTVFPDPWSVEADSSDWNVCFVTELLSDDEFTRRWKDAQKSDWEDLGYGQMKHPWRDDDSVLVAEWWSRDEVKKRILLLNSGEVVKADVYAEQRDIYDARGVVVLREREVSSWEVRQRIVTGAEVLEENDWPGIYIPIVPVWGEEVDVAGDLHYRSLIRDAKDPQKMYNYWRTCGTELVALAPKAPYIGPRGAFQSNQAKWDTANSKSWSYLEYDGDIPPQRQPFAGIPSGALQEALNYNDDIKAALGMYDASLGARSNETSGRAILARQREGDVSQFHFIDNLTRAIRHSGRILLDLIPHVYTRGRIIRTLGEDGSVDEVPLGQPIMSDDGIERVYDLGLGKYDLAVEAGPGFTTRREEAATQMMELVRVYPDAAPVIGDLLVKNLDWPGSQEIAKRLERLLPAAAGGDDGAMMQVREEMAALAAENKGLKDKMQVEVEKLRIEREKLEIEKHEADVKAYEAQTKRMAAIADAERDLPQVAMPESLPSDLAGMVAPQIAEVVGPAVAQGLDQVLSQMAERLSGMITESVSRGFDNLPPLRVQMPRMKRTPRRGKNGLIEEVIDEPIEGEEEDRTIN